MRAPRFRAASLKPRWQGRDRRRCTHARSGNDTEPQPGPDAAQARARVTYHCPCAHFCWCHLLRLSCVSSPVFIGMVWLLVTTLRARAPRGQWLLATLEVLVWWGVHWFVAPSVSLPLYIAYRLTKPPSTAGQKRDNSKSGDSGSVAATKSNPGGGDDRAVSLERGGGLLPKLLLPLVYGMIISSALPPTLTAVGQAVANHATLSWLPWSYHASHSFVRSWLHDTQKNGTSHERKRTRGAWMTA